MIQNPHAEQGTSPPRLDTLPEVLAALSRIGSLVTKSGKGWLAQCPAHDDTHQSLSLNEGTRGQAFILKCHANAGCTFETIMSALRTKLGLAPTAPVPASPAPSFKIAATYDYTDERGTLVAQVVRLDPKSFRQRHVAADGTLVWNLPPEVPRYLYRLHEIRKKARGRESLVAFVAEGEKDVDALWTLNLPATTNIGGAGKWRPEYTAQLVAAKVTQAVILPDNDNAGRTHAEQVASALHAAGIAVKVVPLPVGEKGDVYDYLSAHAKDELFALVKASPVWGPSSAPEPEPVKVDAVEVDKDSFTDVALARMLAASSKQFIRYCEAKSCWYVYGGSFWAQGSGNLVKPFVHQLARGFHERAGAESDPDKRKRYRDQANRLETDRVIRAVINQAMSLHALQIDPTRFDRHRHLLNVLNGTIDLKTGVLRPHNPEDLIARIAPVEYHPEATSELWEQTIELAMARDAEMVSFLQRVLGYALTGYTNEKKFFDAYGPKDTGKTTICRAFEKMLGPDYAHALRAEALMHQRDPEKIPHELADLMGVRFVVVSEVPDDRRFNEELMKTLSGGDVIRACFKYQNTFEFDPQLTLFLYSNERIELGGSDDALWERATSIPFTFNFKTETTPDTSVGTTLELPEHQQGILAWAVRGSVAWAEQGLAPIPEKVREDTEAHRDEVNAVRCFLRERCQEGVGCKVAFQTLHRAYARWAKEEHQEKLSADKFKEQMKRLGHVTMSVRVGSNTAVDGYLALQLQVDVAL